jgi:hypothetical protein
VIEADPKRIEVMATAAAGRLQITHPRIERRKCQSRRRVVTHSRPHYFFSLKRSPGAFFVATLLPPFLLLSSHSIRGRDGGTACYGEEPVKEYTQKSLAGRQDQARHLR